MENHTSLNSYLKFQIPQQMIEIFRTQAEQKINAEGWGKQGRNVAVKVDNFVHCWITEEAFKQLLMSRNIWFRNRGLYFGDSSGAGADFIVRREGKEISIGLRSVAPESLTKWKSVAYPDDRFQQEKEKIAEYHVVCNHDNGLTKFFGIISKEELINALTSSKRMYSGKNQEYFRVIELHKFNYNNLLDLMENLEKI